MVKALQLADPTSKETSRLS